MQGDKVLGDLPSRLMGWIGRARQRGLDRIELDLETADRVLAAIAGSPTPSEGEIEARAAGILEAIDVVERAQADQWEAEQRYRAAGNNGPYLGNAASAALTTLRAIAAAIKGGGA